MMQYLNSSLIIHTILSLLLRTLSCDVPSNDVLPQICVRTIHVVNYQGRTMYYKRVGGEARVHVKLTAPCKRRLVFSTKCRAQDNI